MWINFVEKATIIKVFVCVLKLYSRKLKNILQGLGSMYLDLNVRDLLKGSQLIEIDDYYNLTLNHKGKQFCQDNDLK
jgi:hypothetical protein